MYPWTTYDSQRRLCSKENRRRSRQRLPVLKHWNPRAAPVRYDYVYSVCIYPLIMHLLTALCYTIRAQGVPVSFEHHSD
ncbi:hypothetical protein JG687_00000745 [Phytophthora cactorum]|uniref:Uncharacterized protein n=1 Tax=Phytophthora cactorum TaxID=29920 RepID=A0A8T1V2M6_9STRA|nr:hypothetical protein JG687_00000745 [Phytophthora cactorum]